MTIEEKEQQLIQEINFFNHNMGWWESEFEKVNNELCQIEQKDPLGLKQKQREKLISKIKYLMAKASIEQRVSFFCTCETAFEFLYVFIAINNSSFVDILGSAGRDIFVSCSSTFSTVQLNGAEVGAGTYALIFDLISVAIGF